jgi:hypothetical protein
MKFASVRFGKSSVLFSVFFILLVIYITKVEEIDIRLFERIIKLIAIDLQEDVRRFLYTINRFIPILFDLFSQVELAPSGREVKAVY